MHKNLSGKTDYVAHTRNAAKGKRGVNKAERQVPVPDQDEPAYKHRKKRRAVEKPYLIERFYDASSWAVQFSWYKPGWQLCAEFTKKADRDRELAKALRIRGGYQNGKAMYRAVDREEKE